MDIRDNSLASVKNYFFDRLRTVYPDSEIDTFFKITTSELLNTKLFLSQDDLKRKLSESELLKFISVTKQLKSNKPIQYIFNKAPFWGMDLYVDESVLIPRPETEELIDLILKTLRNDADFYLNSAQQGFGINILDIGTGSGCIALALKKELPQSSVTALDISRQALKVAERNAERLNLKIHPVCADISRDYSEKLNYHVIVSNPPYVTPEEKIEMQSNVLDFEPHLALFAPPGKPLFFYEVIIDFAKKNMVSGGWLFFEINRKYGQDILDVLSHNNFKDIQLLKDINGNYRMIRAKFSM